MPLDRFVLMIVAVIAAAGLTVAVAVWLAASLEWPLIGLAGLLPVTLLGYVLVRVIADRLRERAAEGDRYEGRK